MSGELEITTREERLSTGSETNNNQISFCKMCTVRNQLLTHGDLNGATKLSLVAYQAAQQASAFFSTIILNLIFWKHLRTPLDVILYVILKLTKNCSPLQNIYAPNEDDPTFLKQVFDRRRSQKFNVDLTSF